MFRLWPELHAWNLRFLPFWYLGVFLLAASARRRSCAALSARVRPAWVGPTRRRRDAVYDADAGRGPAPHGLPRRRPRSTIIVDGRGARRSCGVWFNQTQQGFLGYWADGTRPGYENAAHRVDPNFKAAAASSTPSTTR